MGKPFKLSSVNPVVKEY